MEIDEDAGEQAFSCEKPGCEAYCVVALKLDGSEKPFSIFDPQQLQICRETTQ
ncbi:MAG TPA: hypothetical protein VJ836_07975 [Candidatus Saccharimonadales bacterium]|nr:hypothetical protein [Candidatus Saccharimonadales bacterium]